MTEPDSWEDLEQLTLQPVNKPEPENTSETTVEVDAVLEATEEGDGEDGASLDQALKEALKNPRERASVLRIEADVAKFVSDKTRCTIEFASDLSSYQLYGLQTSSIPFGNGLSRVIAHKTQDTKFPPVRVIDVKDIFRPPEAEKTTSTPDVVIKRRQGAALGRLPPDGSLGGGQEGTSSGPRSVKQREEEYKAARERILGPEQRTENQAQDPMTESEEDGKNRKAVFRDRIKEQQDPDYRRGSNRFQTPLVYESSPFGDAGSKTGPPGVYNVPTYTSEFPALPGPRLQPPQFPPMPYPSPPAGYGFPPRTLPFRLPATGGVPPPWTTRPRSANVPPATSPAMMNPAMFGMPSPGFPGYPPGYPMPPRGAYFQPPGATPQGQEGESGGGPVPQVRTLRRKPMPPPPPPPETDGNIQKL